MSEYDPPREIVPIFNPEDWIPFGDDPLTVADGDKRYLKLTGGVEKGSVTFNQGLTSQQPVSINQTLSGVANPILNLRSNSDDAPGVYIDFYKNSQTPAVGDRCGVLTFQGNDSNLDKREYARIRSVVVDPTATSRDGEIDIFVANNNVITSVVQIQPTQTNIQNNLGVSGNIIGNNLRGTTNSNLIAESIGTGGVILRTNNTARLTVNNNGTISSAKLFTGLEGVNTTTMNADYAKCVNALEVDGTMYADVSTGNVGFGTLTPTERIDVAGNVNIGALNTFNIGGNPVIDATSLGSGILNSSLTTVGDLAQLRVIGTATMANIRMNPVGIGINAGQTNQGINAIAIGTEAGRTGQGQNSIAIGFEAGRTNQGQNSIAIGQNSGRTGQGGESVALGTFSGESNQGQNSIAIGVNCGRINQGGFCVAIGEQSGNSGQGINATAVGVRTARTNQGNNATTVGCFSGAFNQGGSAVAVGSNAGQTSQQQNAVAIGREAGCVNQGSNSIAIGYLAGHSNQASYAIAIGLNAGQTNQQTDTVAIGRESGSTGQRANAIAIGKFSGKTGQWLNAIAIGNEAGKFNQGDTCVAIGGNCGETGQTAFAVAVGASCGRTNQGNSCVAVGRDCGQFGQKSGAIAIGYLSGATNQGTRSISIGLQAGQSNQNQDALSIGTSAGRYFQGSFATAIGNNAGNSGQGQDAIAIGRSAGNLNQHNNTIIFNASGLALDSDGTDRTFIRPIRGVAHSKGVGVLVYDTTTFEITYSTN